MIYSLGFDKPFPLTTTSPHTIPEGYQNLCTLVLSVNSTDSAQAEDLEITFLAPYLAPWLKFYPGK